MLAELAKITSGRGADHVFLSAGGNGNGPVEAAVKLARDRARIVDIGKMKLDLPWNAYYEKELDVRFSRSYGPGRYDTRYELEGIDYPAGYVRWTEKRNLESFLDLVARNELDVATLIDGVFPFDEAAKVYGDLKAGTLKAIGVLLEYPVAGRGRAAPATKTVLPGAKTPSVRTNEGGKRRIAVGFVGAGNYAISMLLPHLAKLHRGGPRARRHHEVPVRRQRAEEVRLQHGVHRRRLGVRGRVARRDLHRDQARDARQAGVPRPGDRQGRLRREAARAHPRGDRPDRRGVAKTGNDRLMVGFNRRFAPLLGRCARASARPRPPPSTRYLVNAGPLAKDSWYLNEEAEGSRFTGEGGHFIDTLSWWADSPVEEVYAVRGPEKGDVQATFLFANGASGTIAYLTGGNARFPKETMDATGGGRSARLDNFRSAAVWSGRGKSATKARGGQDKGQRSEMEAVRRGGADRRARCRSAPTRCSPPRGPRSRSARAC